MTMAARKKLNVMSMSNIRDLASYCPDTGIFTVIKPLRRRKIGEELGGLNSRGYRRVKIDGKEIGLHRLAWWFVHGNWPDGDIDHINGNPSDNRIENLRVVTHRQNMLNAMHGKGWCWNAARRKWQVQIWTETGRKYLGVFADESDAKEVYLNAAAKYHGEYSRTLRPDFQSADAGPQPGRQPDTRP